jgi:hypothetical protein
MAERLIAKGKQKYEKVAEAMKRHYSEAVPGIPERWGKIAGASVLAVQAECLPGPGTPEERLMAFMTCYSGRLGEVRRRATEARLAA